MFLSTTSAEFHPSWTIAKVVADKTENGCRLIPIWCQISHGKLPSLMLRFHLIAVRIKFP